MYLLEKEGINDNARPHTSHVWARAGFGAIGLNFNVFPSGIRENVKQRQELMNRLHEIIKT